MELRHVPAAADDADDRAGRALATDVDFAETIGEKLKGLMFREEIPEEYALVFEFPEPPSVIPDVLTHNRSIHMLFVKVPLDVVWLREGVVNRVSTLSPWTGFGIANADTVVELRAGAAEEVEVGDTLRFVDDGCGRPATDPTD